MDHVPPNLFVDDTFGRDHGCDVPDGCCSGKGFHHCYHHVGAFHVPLGEINTVLLRVLPKMDDIDAP